jgi:beta-1,2-mannobiose phosphorylase / 1,2-beta-oligomannan phosphorylase
MRASWARSLSDRARFGTAFSTRAFDAHRRTPVRQEAVYHTRVLTILCALLLVLPPPCAPGSMRPGAVAGPAPWGDTSRLGRPFSKDPSVVRFHGRYLLYYSMPPFGDGRANDGWAVGIAASPNLVDWRKVGEVLPVGTYDRKGIAAPFAKVIGGKVHLLYQTYGNGPADAICHAVSSDGLRFDPDPANPVFRPTGSWNAGRAIDAEMVEHRGRWLLYAATRDPAMKVQLVIGAVAAGGFARGPFTMLAEEPLLKPELPWEQDCIEAPAVLPHGGELFMFYAGAYNNAPQQIGLARSADGVHWTRVGTGPVLPNGDPGTWNSSESGHPGIFVDDDGQAYLFYQGNDDGGKTWRISFIRIAWREGLPVLVQ